MQIFDYTDYKKWVLKRLESLPKNGRGQLVRIAQHLNTSPPIVTQVLNQNREFTPEQAILLADYFGLTAHEKKYLILLVNYSRAGSQRYRDMLKEEIGAAQLQAHEIKSHVNQSSTLSEEAKSVLYSNWFFLAVWSLIAIEGFDSIETISTRLSLSKTKTNEALQFLLRTGLAVEEENKFKIGPTLLHLESSSPFLPRHHQSWRLRAFQRYEEPKKNDCFYTAPVTLSRTDALELRRRILTFISEAAKLIQPSKSEELYCLCLDWFEI